MAVPLFIHNHTFRTFSLVHRDKLIEWIWKICLVVKMRYVLKYTWRTNHGTSPYKNSQKNISTAVQKKGWIVYRCQFWQLYMHKHTWHCTTLNITGPIRSRLPLLELTMRSIYTERQKEKKTSHQLQSSWIPIFQFKQTKCCCSPMATTAVPLVKPLSDSWPINWKLQRCPLNMKKKWRYRLSPMFISCRASIASAMAAETYKNQLGNRTSHTTVKGYIVYIYGNCLLWRP